MGGGGKCKSCSGGLPDQNPDGGRGEARQFGQHLAANSQEGTLGPSDFGEGCRQLSAWAAPTSHGCQEPE